VIPVAARLVTWQAWSIAAVLEHEEDEAVTARLVSTDASQEHRLTINTQHADG